MCFHKFLETIDDKEQKENETHKLSYKRVFFK